MSRRVRLAALLVPLSAAVAACGAGGAGAGGSGGAGGGGPVVPLATHPEVTWLPAKPAGDLVPAGATVLTALLSHGLNAGEPGRPLTTTRDRAVIDAVRDEVDGLPVASPGATSCPADFGQTLTLTFSADAGGPPLAVVVAEDGGCGIVRVTSHGRPASRPLRGPDLTRFVAQQLGWPLAGAA